MKMMIGETFQTIEELEWEYEVDQLNELQSQKDSDEMVTTELYQYIQKHGRIENRKVTNMNLVDLLFPKGVYLQKIKDKSGDVVDHAKRFVIMGTNIQIAINDCGDSFEEILRKLEPLEDAIMRTEV